jgi:hypothetical protein
MTKKQILIKHWRKPVGVAQEMRVIERKAAFVSESSSVKNFL